MDDARATAHLTLSLGNTPRLPVQPLHMRTRHAYDQGRPLVYHHAVDRLPVLNEARGLLVAAHVSCRKAHVARVRVAKRLDLYG